jgi:hypothetical protein
MGVVGGVEDRDDEVRELVGVFPVVARPPVVRRLDVGRLASVLRVDRIPRGDVLRRLIRELLRRIRLLRPWGPARRSWCERRQPLHVRGLVHPTRLVSSAAAGKGDGRQSCSNSGIQGMRHGPTLSRAAPIGQPALERRRRADASLPARGCAEPRMVDGVHECVRMAMHELPVGLGEYAYGSCLRAHIRPRRDDDVDDGPPPRPRDQAERLETLQCPLECSRLRA